MPRPVVISVHGINTRGAWQKNLCPALALEGFVPVPLDYGFFSVGMLFDSRRSRKIAWMRSEYDRVRRMTGIARPSIVCHSFGSWLVGELLRRYDDVRLDAVICAGSILSRDFDWASLLDSGRVLAVRNEVATRDPWPRRAALMSALNSGPDAFGTAGRDGFSAEHDLMDQYVQEIDHSDAFYDGRFEDWCRWLRFPRIPPEQAQGVEEVVALVHQDICDALDWDPLQARASIWAPSGEGHLVVPIDGAQIGLSQEELEIKIAGGQFAVGEAFFLNAVRVVERPISLAHEAPPLALVATAPIRAKDDGHLIGVFAFDSTDPGILPLDDVSKRTVESLVSGAADSIRDVYGERVNGC